MLVFWNLNYRMSKSNFIKTEQEIDDIEEGGKILRRILVDLEKQAVPGVSTQELNAYAEREMRAAGGTPSFIGYGPKNNPFPAGLCTSLNDVVVHGIPSKEDVLRDGDIVGLDIGMEYKGLFTDTAITVFVGTVYPKLRHLVRTTKKSLDEAIKKAVVGNRIGDISHTIQAEAEKNGFSVVRDLVGHGVGYAVHEDPAVPCYGKPGTGPKLLPGMVLAIEPMLTTGSFHVFFDDDGWTIRTRDHSLAAHFEHTIAITDKGPRVLT